MSSRAAPAAQLLNLDNMLEAESILDQRTMRNGRTQYLIQWTGVDPATGRGWEPTWESKSSCPPDLIQVWEEKTKADLGVDGRHIKQEEQEREREQDASVKRKRASLPAENVKKPKVDDETTVSIPKVEETHEPRPQTQPQPQPQPEGALEPSAAAAAAASKTSTINSPSSLLPLPGPRPTPRHAAATSSSPKPIILPPPSEGTNTQNTQASSKSTRMDPIGDFSSPPRKAENVPSTQEDSLSTLDENEEAHQPLADELPSALQEPALDSSNVHVANGPNVDALLEKLDAQTKLVESLTTKLQRAQEKHQTLAEENSFLQNQYQIASNSAVAEVGRVNQLQAELEKVKSQLSIGLKQRDIHYEAIKAKRATENTKLRGQMNILLEQARRTDDVVRRKAAAHDRLKEENERLATQNYELRTKCSTLQDRNEELVDLNTTLRARIMGAVVDNDELDSEGDAEDDVTDASSPLVEPKSDPSGLGYAGGLSSHVFTSSQIIPSDSQLGGVGVGGGVVVDMGEQRASGPDGQVVEGGSAYLCKWGDDGNPCELAFDTHADLAEHSRGHVL